ncbi:MAG: UPF0210 protein [Planctomycetaceae bacterium]|nr:MAG: UPF0210 protein [Planctomycetaceae bacterium]
MPIHRHSLLDPHTAAFPPLEVRTVTLNMNAADLSDRQLHRLCEGLYQRIIQRAGTFVSVCSAVSAEYGVPILQRRLCVHPIDRLAEGFSEEDVVNIARTLDGAAGHVRVDQIAGFLVRVAQGLSHAARRLLHALPLALAQTERVQAAVEAARSSSGLSLEVIRLLGEIVKHSADVTADRHGLGAAKLSVLANLPVEGPPIAGVAVGDGWGDLVVHVSMSAMSALRHAIEQRLLQHPDTDVTQLAADLKAAAFQATRVAELVGREIAARLGAEFGCVDVSLAPTIRPGQTIAELMQRLGIGSFGTSGTAAALMMLWHAVRSAGQFAASSSGSHAAILLPVLRDAGLVAANEAGSLALEHLELLSAVGGSGLDLIPLPGDTSAETLSAVLADQLAVGVVLERPTVVRLIPVPGKKAGERVSFGRDLGDAVIFSLKPTESAPFLQRGGRIPPMH